MRTRRVMLELVLLAAVLTVIWTSAARWARADRIVAQAARQHELAAADVHELLVLESRQERVGLQERPEQDVIAQVNDVLAEIGLVQRRLKRLTAEGDVAVPQPAGSAGPEYRRQSVRLILQQMTMRDLGLFLSVWRASHPVWVPTRLEIARMKGRTAEAGRYDVTIILSAAYVAGDQNS